MNVRQAKGIPLEDFLMKIGYQPIKEKGGNVWYLSPLRQESTPSFKVNRTLNSWYDFGIGEGGNIIKLISLLLKTENISEVLKYIETKELDSSVEQRDAKASFSFPKQEKSSSISILNIKPLKSNILKSYLFSRGITERCFVWIKELDYLLNGKNFFGVGFMNDKKGYEIRNAKFKSCTSKAITSIINNPASPIYVFEGFMDFLSFFELINREGISSHNKIIQFNYLVLNSTALTKDAILILKQFKDIRLFLDRDNAGLLATQEIMDSCQGVLDYSILFSQYEKINDLNEFLLAGGRIPILSILS